MKGYIKYLGPAENLVRQHESGAENRWVNLALRAFKGRTIPSLEEHASDSGVCLDRFQPNAVKEGELLIADLNEIKEQKKIDPDELRATLFKLRALIKEELKDD